jgi:hypothetical protein
MGELGGRVLGITQDVLGAASAGPAATAALSGLAAAGDAEGVADRYDELFTDVFDTLLDAVDNYADEASGDRQAPRMVVQRLVARQGSADLQIVSGKNVGRPQETFEDRVDNFPRGPWVPRITEKPNAKVPLDLVFATFEASKKNPMAVTATAAAAVTATAHQDMESHMRALEAAAKQ